MPESGVKLVHADGLGEGTIVVGEHGDLSVGTGMSAQAFITWTSFTVTQTTESTPLALMASMFSKARQVIAAAGRREGTRHGEEHDLAAGEDPHRLKVFVCHRRPSTKTPPGADGLQRQ